MERPSHLVPISFTLNGCEVAAEVTVLELVAELVRDRFHLTGTHVGCEAGSCGACTILVNGQAVRACLMLAAQADGSDITTIEGLPEQGVLGQLQPAFVANRALQCGFCTSGVLMSMAGLLLSRPNPSRDEIRTALDGHVCRCGCYQGIVDAVASLSAAAAE